jgi:hypothetical protein
LRTVSAWRRGWDVLCSVAAGLTAVSRTRSNAAEPLALVVIRCGALRFAFGLECTDHVSPAVRNRVFILAAVAWIRSKRWSVGLFSLWLRSFIGSSHPLCDSELVLLAPRILAITLSRRLGCSVARTIPASIPLWNEYVGRQQVFTAEQGCRPTVQYCEHRRCWRSRSRARAAGML